VLNLLAQGKSNKQIAAILNITETTVKFHVRTLFTTFGVNNRTWCVREASRRGLIETDNI
ncbi:MAG: LuxR C-terminal-related transcriptional regulator, partial [Pseudomonadales bacterium]